MKKRPSGITLLASLCFLGTFFYCVLLVLAILDRSMLRSLLETISGGGAGPVPLMNLGAMLPYYFLIMALVSAALGMGMWELANWARVGALLLAGLSILGAAVEIVRAWPQSTLAGLTGALARVGVAVLIFWYLRRASVRAAFRPWV